MRLKTLGGCHRRFMLQYLLDHKMYPDSGFTKLQLYTTYLASSFRSLRFGVKEAHGKGMAMQVNYLMDKGAVIVNPDGTFAVDASKIKGAVRDLDHDPLTLEARGDYNSAKQMLDKLAVLRAGVAERARPINRFAGGHRTYFQVVHNEKAHDGFPATWARN